MKYFLYLTLSTITLINHAMAMRPSHDKKLLLNLGFTRVTHNEKSYPTQSENFLKLPLNWPLTIKQSPQQFISNFHQYQTFTTPAYYHAGLDILADKGQKVFANVSGIISGGYYSYTDEIDGTSTKYYLPLKKALEDETKIPWGKDYFEIAITDEWGNTFEYHHINPDSLPVSVLKKVIEGGLQVFAGEHIGNVHDINMRRGNIELTHIHYNVINSDGTYLNPFFISPPIKDDLPPKVLKVHATKKGNCYSAPELIEITNEKLIETEQEVILEAYDNINPLWLAKAPEKIIAYYGERTYKIDFSKNLLDQNGERHHIQKIYLPSQCHSARGSESRASSTHRFFFRIPIALGYKGQVHIEVYDQNGNMTSKTIEILKSVKRRYHMPKS